MRIRTAKAPHRAKWIAAPIHGLSKHNHARDGASVHLMLENHSTGGFTELEFTAADARSPYFEKLLEHLSALKKDNP